MANVVMQYTNNADSYGDFMVFDDLTVEKGGVPDSVAVASFVDGQYRLDVQGLNVINANQEPYLGTLVLFRQPGFGGSLGWRAVLQGWDAGQTPNAIGLGVYSTPGVANFLWTTGGFIWEPTEEYWYVDVSPGFEPATGESVYFAYLWGSLPVSPFTYFWQYQGNTLETGQSFSGGGDFG